MKIAQAPIKIVHADECMDVRDGTHDSPKFIEKGIPLVTSKNLVNGKIDFSTCSFISEEDHAAISKRSQVDDGDILYAMIGTIGNPVIVQKNIEFSIKNVALFKFNNSEAYNRYIYHFLNSEIAKKQLSKLSRGGTQKFVSLGNLRKLKIPLPPLEEQRRIASVLDKADDLRQKRQQAIEKLDQLLQATFIDMFGDPITNSKNFSLTRLEDLVTKPITYGVLKPEEYNENGIPMLRIQDINTKKNLNYLKDFHLISNELSNQYKRTILNGLEIVISLVGTIGLVAKIPKKFKGFNVHRNLGVIDLRDKNMVDYILYFMKMPEFLILLDRISKGGVHKLLNLTDLRAFEFPIPPKELQDKWSKIALNIEDQKQKLYKQLDMHNQLFSSLQNQAFSGNL